ncbi:MAG: hypothetical protein U1D30_02360 [Planctomycetota bacterium]
MNGKIDPSIETFKGNVGYYSQFSELSFAVWTPRGRRWRISDEASCRAALESDAGH